MTQLRDPVALLEEQNRTREPGLVPIRHGRMMASPFTFYRGAARLMAEDLASEPSSGPTVQLCGDAHVSNFGVFASPERRLMFDLNDFDETLPGPFEYDVKRMATSFAIAGLGNGFGKGEAASVARTSVRAYRKAMRDFTRLRTLDVWYSGLTEADVVAAARANQTSRSETKRGKGVLGKARTRDSLQAVRKLAEEVDGDLRIRSQPPVLVPLRELAASHGYAPGELWSLVCDQFERYKETLADDRRRLLDRFTVVDMALKVVGVGSVGTRAFIVLLVGKDAADPLFLQVKEATASVLEAHLPPSRYPEPGERVVQGQRLMQSSSDIFLGWTTGVEAGRHFYWRQLRDMKGSALVEGMSPRGMSVMAGLCGWTLARAHARSGDPAALRSHMGKGPEFDKSITEFGMAYVTQNDQDYNAFLAAVEDGRLEARTDV